MTLPHRSRSRRIAAALVAATCLALSACGASGGSDPAAKVTNVQLKGTLPKAADIGAPYVLDTSKDDNSTKDPGDKAIDKACPDAKALFGNSGSSKDQSVKFKTDDNRSIEVDAGHNDQGITNAKVDSFVAAINKCKPITYTDQGSTFTGTLGAKRDDSYGDFGMAITFDLGTTVSGVSIEIHLKGNLWVRNGLSGGVVVTSGFDQSTFANVKGDFDKIPALAQAEDAKLKALTS